MKQECPRLLAFAVQYYVYLFFNPLALYRVFGEDEQELIELANSLVDLRAQLIAGLTILVREPAGNAELEKRLLAQVCEICEATHLTTQIEVHHIRALKDLKPYDGREKPLWVKIMAARRRKTLVLCRTCHDDLHAGRPLKRKHPSRSRKEE